MIRPPRQNESAAWQNLPTARKNQRGARVGKAVGRPGYFSSRRALCDRPRELGVAAHLPQKTERRADPAVGLVGPALLAVPWVELRLRVLDRRPDNRAVDSGASPDLAGEHLLEVDL
jgi:hypothetical protein